MDWGTTYDGTTIPRLERLKSSHDPHHVLPFPHVTLDEEHAGWTNERVELSIIWHCNPQWLSEEVSVPRGGACTTAH